MNLTICYLTNRRQPMFEWFCDSFARQASGLECRLVMVDFFADEPGRHAEMLAKAKNFADFVHVPPKPTVWQGKHRLTGRDYFAASNVRNTGLCLAPTDWIAYVDDLSVLLPDWVERIRLAMKTPETVTAGAYRKVCDLVVERGEVKSFSDCPQGHDSRWKFGSDSPVRIGGGSMFGCSLCAPVEALLTINGWDEDCDSMGGEDSICGLMIENSGYKIVYDRRMMTYESEERHNSEVGMAVTTPAPAGQDKNVLRIIKMNPSDSSWTMLNWVTKSGRHRAPNYFGPGGIRELRRRVLAGEEFPVAKIPEHDWRDGQPLAEM